MNGLLEHGSAGAVVSLAARLVGWSPVGKLLTISSAEGPGAAALEGQVFEVREVREDALVASLRGVREHHATGRPSYLLRPRHRGWTAGSLMATSIAVTVHEVGPQGPGEAVAIAVVRRAR